MTPKDGNKASSGKPPDAPAVDEITEVVCRKAQTDGIDDFVEVREAKQRPVLEPQRPNKNTNSVADEKV